MLWGKPDSKPDSRVAAGNHQLRVAAGNHQLRVAAGELQRIDGHSMKWDHGWVGIISFKKCRLGFDKRSQKNIATALTFNPKP